MNKGFDFDHPTARTETAAMNKQTTTTQAADGANKKWKQKHIHREGEARKKKYHKAMEAAAGMIVQCGGEIIDGRRRRSS